MIKTYKTQLNLNLFQENPENVELQERWDLKDLRESEERRARVKPDNLVHKGNRCLTPWCSIYLYSSFLH